MGQVKVSKETSKDAVLALSVCPDRCGHCCTMGSGFLAKQDFPGLMSALHVDEEQLKARYLEQVVMFNTELWRPRLLKNGKLPFGPCIFHKKGVGCTVQAVKPLHCRVGSPCSPVGEQIHQWFMLNYAVNATDPVSIREWAIYLQHASGVIPGGTIEDLVPDTERRKKIFGYKM